MRVFLTGATGFVGTALVRELLNSGHQVSGLARSDAAARALANAGAQVHRGDLEDADSLRSGVAAADGVIHTGFIHDFARFQAVCEIDRQVIETLAAALAGSGRPLVVTSGIALVAPGRLATEEDVPAVSSAVPRVASEQAARAAAERGVRAAVVRLSPTVHDDGDHGFVPMLIAKARATGLSAYVDEGLNRWSAVHRLDAARLYRLALEQATPGARFHGVAEEGIPFRSIAEIIGRRLGLPVVSKTPEQAAAHFGWFAHFASIDCPASSQRTQALLGWRPTQPTLFEDLERTSYFETPAT